MKIFSLQKEIYFKLKTDNPVAETRHFAFLIMKKSFDTIFEKWFLLMRVIYLYLIIIIIKVYCQQERNYNSYPVNVHQPEMTWYFSPRNDHFDGRKIKPFFVDDKIEPPLSQT